MMKAGVYTQGSGFEVEELPVPEIAADEILLKVHASSICGTDVRIIKNGHRKLKPGQKVVLGHEFAGTVVKSGGRAHSYPIGARVGVAPNIGCGACEFCARSLTNMCPDYTAFGITFDGAHTEFVRIPGAAIAQGNVFPLPDSISFTDASLIEPLSCVVNGSRAGRIALGDVVLIMGAGPIGLMHLALARLSGASKVIVSDVQSHRLASALEMGADVTVNPSEESIRDRIMFETRERGADVAITACSIPSVQEQSIDLLAPYGRVCFFGGLPEDNSKISIDTNLVHYKNLVLTGVTGGSPYDFLTAMKLIEEKRVDVAKMVSHVFPMANMAEAFNTAMNGETMKVVISYGG